MTDKNELLKALRAGKSAEDLAQELIDELNAAIKAKNAEDEAARAAESKSKEKMEKADEIVKLFTSFVKNYYDFKVDGEITGKHLVDVLDSVTEMKIQLTELKNLAPKAQKKEAEKKVPAKKAGSHAKTADLLGMTEDELDEAIAEWLDNL